MGMTLVGSKRLVEKLRNLVICPARTDEEITLPETSPGILPFLFLLPSGFSPEAEVVPRPLPAI